MDFRKIAIAALKAAETKDEVSYVFDIFGFTEYYERAELLKETMGGKYFNLPQDYVAQCDVLISMFIDGRWRYAEQMGQLKSIVNKNF